jgi:putative tryptophan/tyrosine transport system ATP-binding protein
MYREVSPTSALAITGVSKTFHRGLPDERRALVDVDLTLADGDFAVIIGSNGAGKSTLLSVVAGDVTPDVGTVKIGGADVTALSVHRRAKDIGRVFQDPSRGTSAGLTVEENLALALRRGQGRGLRAALTEDRRHLFRDAVAPLGLGLEQRLDARVDLLSGGQRQALSLVMACLVRPRLLILDEHCAALDPRTAEAVMAATVTAIGISGIAALMVTHNMKHAIDHGNRLVMMHEGRIVFEAAGAAKRALTVDALVQRFQSADDKMLLVR